MSLKDIIVKIVADDQTKTGLESATKNIKGMESAASSLTKHLAGLVTVGAFVGLAKEAIDMGSALDDASKKFGVSAEDLSELQYVAKLSGVEFEALGKSFKFLNKAVAEAENPTSDQAIAFKALGLSLEELKTKSPNELFDIMADKLSGMKDGANKTALALAVFGKSGVDLLPVLEGGAKGLHDMREEGKRLGATLTQEEITKLDAYGDAIDKIGMASKATAGKLMVDMVEGVKALWDSIEKYGDRIELFYARVFGGEEAVAATKEKQAAAGVKTTGEFVGPPKPKVEGPNLEATKKANEEQKKLEERIAKYNEKKLFDTLMAQAEVLQDFYGDAAKLAAQAAEEDINAFEARQKLAKATADYAQELRGTMDALGVMDFEAELADAMPRVDELVQKMKSITPAQEAESAFNVAMAYGNAKQALDLLNEGLYEHFRTLTEAQERVSSMGQLYNTVFRGADGVVSDLAQASIRAFHSMEDAVVEFAMTGKMSFKEFANSVIADLMRIAARQAIVQPIAQGIMGAFGLAPLPAMASGGPVIGGVPYTVGERGPETFIPGSSGTILPNGSGGSNSVTVNIKNQSGEAVEAKTARASFDPQGWVIDVVLDGLNRNVRGLRTALGGA